MIVGERVLQRMDVLNIGQTELGRRVGVSQAAVWQIIHKNKIGSRYLHELARELQTTPAYLTGETDDPDTDAPDVQLSAPERDLLDLFRGLPPKERATLLRVAEGLAAVSLASSSLQADRHDYRAEG